MFRFTIRDVLWLTVVVGVGLGWFVDRRWQPSFHRELRLFVTSRIRADQRIELRVLPNGEIDARIVYDR